MLTTILISMTVSGLIVAVIAANVYYWSLPKEERKAEEEDWYW